MRKNSKRLGRVLCALSASAVAGQIASQALANSGIQLPLSQYQAGTEQTTPVTNGGFEQDGVGNLPTPIGWTRAGTEMFVDPVYTPPPLNPAAVGSFSAQTRGTTASSYDQPVTGLIPGKNYLLSAYVWNAGEFQSPGGVTGDFATIKVVDPANSFNNVSMLLEGKGTDGQSGSTGRFMYLLFNTNDTATWSGVNVQIISETGNYDDPAYTRPNPWAQYDNIAVTPAETFVAQKWLSNTSGNWTDNSKWSGGVNPNTQQSPLVTSNHAVASFTNGITSNQTITVDQPRTVGIINFNNPTASYTIAGGNAITFDVTLSGSTTQGVPEIAVVSGSHEISAPINLVRDLILDTAASSTLTLSGDLAASGKTVTNRGSGTARLKNLRSAGLVMNGGTLQIIPNSQAPGVSKIDTVSIPIAGKLDLTDNKLITASPVGTWTGTTYTGITGEIQTGRGPAGGSNWDGPNGIITSQTAATTGNLTSIGVATAQQVKGITATSTAVWAGQTVTGSDTLVMYTYGGDANLDGKLNVDDYGRIDFNVPLGSTGWYNGDFNYDGKINVDDYGIINFNIGIQGTPFFTAPDSELPGALSAVPEPAGVSLVGLTVALLTTRRTKRARTP